MVDGLSPDEVEDHAARHLIVFEPVEDVVDRGQRLQLDIGLDFALGGQRQPAAISSRLPTKEPRMVMQFATTSNSAAARVQQRPRRRASDQRDELAPLHPSSFQPLTSSLSRCLHGPAEALEPSSRARPIAAPMHPIVQVFQFLFESFSVGLPCHAIDSRRRVPREREIAPL